MKKFILFIICMLILTSCGGETPKEGSDEEIKVDKEETGETGEKEEKDVDEDKKLNIGIIQGTLASEVARLSGDKLKGTAYEITFMEYETPEEANAALISDTIDASLCQTLGGLKERNKDGFLSDAGEIYQYQYGVFTSYANDYYGIYDKADIYVPDDPEGYKYALETMADGGYITINENHEITGNPQNLNIIKLGVSEWIQVLTNQKRGYLVCDKSTLQLSGYDIMDTYLNEYYPEDSKLIITVKAGNEGLKKITDLKGALSSKETDDFLTENYPYIKILKDI